MGVPLRAGRDFTDGDRRGGTMVAVINESLARASFPGKNPIAARIQCGLDVQDFMTIVGVVGDVRTWGRGPDGRGSCGLSAEAGIMIALEAP